MNDQYRQIKSELEFTKKELEERLDRSYHGEFENFQSVATIYEQEKKFLLEHYIQAELEDVNRALLKIEFNLYGLCEETGLPIPLEKLQVLPTVRTLKEACEIGQSPFMVSKMTLSL